jgi:hypothetical protein
MIGVANRFVILLGTSGVFVVLKTYTLASFVLIVFLLTQIGCGKSHLPKGQSFETIDEQSMITVLSDTELDLKYGDGQTLAAEYSVTQDGRIRVVLNSRMGEEVTYYDLFPYGLVSEHGEMFFPINRKEEALSERVQSVLPDDLLDSERSVLSQYLKYRPRLRLLTNDDIGWQDDIPLIQAAYDNDQLFKVRADFNDDGVEDLAVVFYDEWGDHPSDWNTALAVFNGPHEFSSGPSFARYSIGAISGSILFYTAPNQLMIGAWEGGASLLQPVGEGYRLR